MRSTAFMMVAVVGLALSSVVGAAENSPPPAKRSTWNGYERIDFTWASRPCVLVRPQAAAAGNPWFWRAESFEAQPEVGVELGLLQRGWHVAYIDAPRLYGSRQAMGAFGELYAHLVTHAALSQRVVMAGSGPGGLSAFNFAVAHPSRIAALYLDRPVLDLRSWPGRNRASTEWKEALAAYGLTEQTFETFRGHPLDRVSNVARARVPIVLVRRDGPASPAFEENGGVLERRYREAGGTIEVIHQQGDRLNEPAAVVEFLVKHARF